MKALPPRATAGLAALLLAGALAMPAAARPDTWNRTAAERTELAQFFERGGRRDERSRRPDRRIEPVRPPAADRNGRGPERRPQPRLDREEQDRALDARRRGAALPLSAIIRGAQSYCPGTFLDAALERRGDALAYRIAILRPSGRRVVLLLDAASGALLAGRCR